MADIPTGSFEHTLEEIDAAVDAVADKASQEDLDALAEAVEDKQDALTFDSTPTANSDNPVKSKGIKSYVDTGLSGKQDTLTFDSTPTANSDNPVKSKGIKSYVDAETTARQAECGVIANAGAKNVSRAVFTSGTNNGVTFTANADGTVTANSTGTQSQNATLQSTTFLLKAGTYTFSCSPNPQRDVTYDAYVYDTDNSRSIARDNPNDSPRSTFTLSVDTNVRINLRVNKTYTANNLFFSPMIRHAEITDATYQPYAPTNRELYEMILAMQ